MTFPTLKTLREIFKSFFDSHAQVRLYHYGDLAEYTAIANKLYFAANLEYTGSIFPDANTIRHNFNLVISGRFDRNYPGTEHDAVSDCLQIAVDFTAMLANSDWVYSSSAIEPFREADGDFTAGVVLSLGIITGKISNDCETPRKDA